MPIAMAACVIAACSQPAEAPQPVEVVEKSDQPLPHVIFISVDTLRSDHMSVYGYHRDTTPRLKAFFEDGTVFENAYATTSFTPPSVYSFLTGLLPQHHGVRRFTEHPKPELNSLPRTLAAAGYQTSAVVSNVVLTGDNCGLDAHFDVYNDFVDPDPAAYRGQYQRKASETTDAALTWLHTERDPSRPLFLWLHFIDPHGPYEPPQPKPREFSHDGVCVVDAARVPSYQLYPGPVDALEYVDLYDEEIAYTDAEIGRFLEGLEEALNIENTAFVFTSDHGETMMEHEKWFTHDYHVYEELVRVPLMFKGPAFAAKRESARVSIVDIVPTLLDALDIESPGDLDGYSLLEPIPNRTLFFESNVEDVVWRGALADQTKWLLSRETKPGGAVTYVYYNLEADPEEQNPVTWRPAEAHGGAMALLAMYKADRIDYDHPDDFQGRGILLNAFQTPEDLADVEDQLRAMGYLE